jgi:hypothetical protein
VRESGIRVDRFWVNRFVWRNVATLRIRQTNSLEEDRHNVIADNVKYYFDCVNDRLPTALSVLT